MVAFTEKRPTTLVAAVRYFSPEVAQAFVNGIKWPNGPHCPVCGSVRVGHIASRDRHQCREKRCRKQFSLTTGTIFEGTHIGLDQWCVAVWLIANCRNGISSCEIARTLGIRQQSAWHLMHRIRHLMTQEGSAGFRGVIESDETFVGGLFRHMSPARRQRAREKGGPKGAKTVVHALKERRTGIVHAEVIPGAQTEYVQDVILEHAKRGSIIHTDESKIYQWVSSSYRHRTVNHAKQY